MVTCTATVNDGLEIVQDSDSVLVNNQPPVIDSISIEPDTARIGDDVQCTIVARDPDLETPVTGIEWFQNGEFVSSEPVLTLEPATFHKGDTIECVGSASDADDGIHPRSTTIEILNPPPTFSPLSLLPERPSTQDVVNCIPSEVIDPDEDEVTFVYRWLVDGRELMSTDASITGNFSVDETIQCTATIYDSEDIGNSLTIDTIVQNTPPSIDSLIITPSTEVEADSLVECISTANDVDGQKLITAYQWTVGEWYWAPLQRYHQSHRCSTG